ncbi:hypothetical protein HMPREF9570_02139, partial [Cutibacterium acnes HL043PA1]
DPTYTLDREEPLMGEQAAGCDLSGDLRRRDRDDGPDGASP